MRILLLVTALGVIAVTNVGAEYVKEADTFYPPDEDVQASLDLLTSMRKQAALEGMLKLADIERKRQGFAADPANYESKFRETADYWVQKDDDFLRDMLPAENPHMLVPSYAKGCPLHLGGVHTMRPIWGKPNHFRCQVGGEEWGPGMQVKNPGTGETITIEDDGYGWECPQGFPNPGRYYFVAAYRLALIGKLTSRPYRPFEDFDGPSSRAALWCLGYIHALSQKPEYAHKALVILTRLADVYHNYASLYNWRKYPARAYIQDHNFEPDNIHQCLEAYDFCFDAIAQDQEILEWFKQSRDNADCNGDGTVDAEDIKYYIERDLFGYMYEYLHRAIPLGRGNTRTTQVRSMMEMALNLRHDRLFEEALNGRYGIANLMTNCIYRDGRFYEDSTGYSLGVNNSYLTFGTFIDRFRGREIHPDGIKIDELLGRRYSNIRTFAQRAACAGRYAYWGDGGNARTAILKPTPEPQKSVLFGDIGYSIMRSIGPSEQQLHLLLNFAQSGAGHGHRDQLMLKPIRWGYDFTADLGYPHNLASPKRGEWTANTVTHCSAMVDNMEQRSGCTGTLDLYADAGWLQLTAAYSNDAYDEAELYHRTAAIVSMSEDAHYIVDIFRIKGGERRDYIYHSLSGEEGANFALHLPEGTALEELPGTLAGPQVEWMANTGKYYGSRAEEQPNRKSGYSYIKDISRAEAAADRSCEWRVGDDQDTGLKLWMAGAEGRQLYLGKGEGRGAPGRSPWDAYIIARDDTDQTGSDESIYCGVFEPFQGEPRIIDVEWLQLKPASDSDAMPVAVKVTTPAGHFVVFSALDTAGAEQVYEFDARDGEYIFEGRFHALRVVTGGDIQTVEVDPAREPALTGQVNALDFDTPAVTVAASAPLPTGDELAGRPIMFEHPDWPKNTVFTIKAITPVEGAKALTPAPTPAERVPAPSGRGENEYVIALDDPGLESAVGTLDKVNTEDGWVFTKDHLEKMFNCHYLYDGKALYSEDKSQWFQIETARTGYYSVGDVTIKFKDKAAAENFKPGDRFWIMDVNPGATFRINRVLAAFG